MRILVSPLLLLFATYAVAFSSVAAPTGQVPMGTTTAPTSDAPRSIASAGSWRVVLNIGRDGFTSMPLQWGASGCRLPLVIKADFNDDGQVVPREDTCRFTGPAGEVVTPVREGSWTVSNDRNLEFSLKFPERIERRDVFLDAGTEITCEGLVFSKDDIKEKNDRFYKAREETWKVGRELNDITRRSVAPKKWNPESNRWEKRHNDEPIWNQIGKRLQLMNAQGEAQNKNAERPNPKTLSLESGPFPGFDNNVFVKKDGVIRIKCKGWRDAVIGTWSAEPINDKPVSYYNS